MCAVALCRKCAGESPTSRTYKTADGAVSIGLREIRSFAVVGQLADVTADLAVLPQ